MQGSFQRVEKIKLQISTRCETLRNGAEFRILRRKMYIDTSTEQKTENAKSGLDSMSKPLLQSLRQRNALQPLFT